MTDDRVLVFREGDEVFSFEAHVDAVNESPHTGRPLRNLSTEMTVPAGKARAIRTLLETPRLIDPDGSEWSGTIQSESYGEVQGLHRLAITWHEHEPVHAKTVEFEGLELRPSSYVEHAEDGGIAITFRARLTPAETESIRALQLRASTLSEAYFPVIRHGVSDEPREMRFGQVLWQGLDNGNELRVTLVDKALDEQPPGAFAMIGEPHTRHLLRAVEQLLGERDALLGALKNAGALDEDTIERIHRDGTDAIGKRRYRFYEVDDLSNWD